MLAWRLMLISRQTCSGGNVLGRWADKFKNIVDCQISDYLDKTDFVERFARGEFGKVRAIFHEGACSDTMETDGRYMMDNNYRYSLAVMRACLDQGVQFLYASSAATYGASETFREEPEFERPLNVYGYSKLLFDQIVRRVMPTALSQIVGFRYFNVYGPREQHKGRMASVAFHNFNQFRSEGTVKLFGEYNGYPQGGQMRDFVSVEDVVKVNLFFFDNPDKSGIFNLGTGRAQPFNDIATTVVNTLRGAEGKPALSTEELAQEGLIEYVKFPDALRGTGGSRIITAVMLTMINAIDYGMNVQEAVVDEPDHRHQGRQARHGGGHAGRQPPIQ